MIVDDAVRELDKEEGRILEAYRLSVISPEQLASELEKLKTRRDLLQAKRLNLNPETGGPRAEVPERSIVDYCKQASDRLDKFSLDEKQQFLRLLLDEVVLDRGRVRIRGVISVPENPRQEFSDQPDSSLSEGRTADMTAYRRGRSSVTIKGFETCEVSS